MKLRVYWIPNPPREAHKVDVETVDEAIKVLNILAFYDLYLGDDVIGCNVGGLEVFNEEDKEWEDYYDEEGRDIREIENDMEDV